MSIEKSEIKTQLYGDIGSDIDAQVAGAEADMHASKGAATQLLGQAKKLTAILELIQKDLDAGELAIITESPAMVAKYAKLMISRCIEATENAGRHQENLVLMSQGAIAAMRGMKKAVEKKVVAEDLKVEATKAAVLSGARVTGSRPGPSIAAQRKAEAVKKKPKRKAKKKTEAK